MARQGIFTGSSPNDGTGDSLLVGASKINQNFSEIYSTFGNGNNLESYSSSSGISTVSQGLTGTPSITVNKIVAGLTSSIIPFLWEEYVDLPSFSSYHGAFAHVHETGKAYYAHTRWIELVNTEADRTVGTGTENYNVGVVTAASFFGDGSNLTNIGGASNSIQIGDDGSPLGAASTINFGSNLTVTVTGGIASVSATGAGLGTETDPIFTASVAFGISSTDTSNWNTAYGWGDHSVAGYASTSYVDSAVVGFITSGALVGYATEGYVTTQIGLNTFTGAASTITSGQISNWDTSYSWGDHNSSGYLTTAFSVNDLSDVNAGAPQTGQVLKWSGTEWNAAADLTADGGTGIGLSDLSVTITSSGINSLTYSSTTGIFLFTPTNLVGYATEGYVTTQIGLNTFTGAASTITSGQISNWDTSYGWGDHDLVGYLTDVNITAGSNITVLETSEGNFIITSTSVSGAGTTWSTNAAGIHTTKNVGIGTALSSSTLTVEGDGRFSGIVTATRFESVSAGTPTIDSPNNLNINAVLVAISTDVTIGDELRVAGITTIGPGGIRVAGVVTATTLFVNGDARVTGIVTIGPASITLDGNTNVINVGTGVTIDGSTGSINATSINLGGTTLTGSAVTSITAGSGISVDQSTGNVTVSATSGGGESYWVETGVGIHTLSNVGIGTTNPTSTLTVGGDVLVSDKIVAGLTSSIIPFYWENFADLPSFSAYHGAFAHVHQTGKAYYAHTRWIELVHTEVNGVVGTGTENYNVGVVTATTFFGSGSGLTNIPSNQLSGALPALDGSALIGLVGVGTGVEIQENGSPVGTAVTINFGTNLDVSFAGGVATVDATGGGGSSQFVTTAAGIHTLSNVGIGTTNPTSKLTVSGDVKVTGVVTATTFIGSLTGTATSTTNIPNLVGNIVSIGNNTSLGSITSDALRTSLNSTTGTGAAVFATSPIFVTPALGTPASGILNNCTFPTLNQNTSGTAGGLTGTPNITVGVATATSFRSNSTSGNGTDVGFAIRYYVTASSFSAYRFAGPGLVNTTNNPTIYLHRGFTYIFENSTGGSHPFAIRYSSLGTGYGSTYLSGSQTGTQVFTVPFDAPATLVYQCTAHSSMLGTFNIVT